MGRTLAACMTWIAVLVWLLSLGACVVHVGGGSGMSVNGHDLEHRHVETIPVDDWGHGLGIDVAAGEVRITEGHDRIEVEVWTREHGEAHAVLEDGVLRLHRKDDAPAAIGDVVVYTSRPLPPVAVETGAGDVELLGVDVDGTVTVSTGAGDCRIEDVTAGDVRIDTGAGDVTVRDSRVARIEADTGIGDVRVDSVTYASADLDTGLGTVQRTHGHSGHGE